MKRKKRIKYARITSLSLLMVITIFGLFWPCSQNRNLFANTPKPGDTNPNAYDFYMSAVEMISDPGRLIDYPNRPKGFQSTSDPYDKYYSLEEKEIVLKANEQALIKFREGLNYDYINKASFQDNMSQLGSFRNLARLVRFESVVLLEKGEYSKAVNNLIDGFKLATDTPRDSAIIGELAGIAIEMILRQDIWEQIPRLNANEAKTAVEKLEKIQKDRYPIYKVFEDEKKVALKNFSDTFLINQDQKPFSNEDSLILKNEIKKYSVYFDKLIETGKKPLYSVRTEPKPYGELSEIISPVVSRARYRHEQNAMFSNMLLLELALRAYKLENGKYPNSLSELAPKYLSKLPDDPFALKGTFQYTNKGDKYLLYSIGPDFIDNKGLPIVYTLKDKIVNEDSKGDVVAGINYK